MTASPTYRVGPRMFAALECVGTYPGIIQYQAAAAVGPHQSNDYGTRILSRCYDAGLIERRLERGQNGYLGNRLTLTPYGRIVLESDEVRYEDIRKLRDEAAQAGDQEQVALCDKALRGEVDGRNWQCCAQVIAEHRINVAQEA